MKNAFIKLLKVKSLVTIALTAGMVLLLTGVVNPAAEVLALYSASYGAVITYFFTRKDKEIE
jgi:hypothetical protein